jgi:hypothetical protein
MKFSVVLFLVTVVSYSVFSQDDDGLLLGKNQKQPTAALYDLSNPLGVNIEVNIWGFIRFPGRYIVPVKTTFMDLMSYAGGPLSSSNLKDIRIIRNSTNSTEKPKIIKLDYNDLLWEDKISGKSKLNPELQVGDVILILEEKRYTIREDVGFFLPILSALVGITTLILTIINRP